MPVQPSVTDHERSFIKDARRRQIVEAAIQSIAELGFQRSSFSSIAARAQISPSLVAYHFRSKAELNHAIAQEIQRDLDGSVSAAAAQASSHLDAVRRIVVGFIEYVDRNRDRMLALRQMDVALDPEERAAIPVLNEDDGIRRWQDLLESGQRAGEFRALDSRSVAVAIMGVLSAVPRELIGNPNADPARLAEELAALITAGIVRTSR